MISLPIDIINYICEFACQKDKLWYPYFSPKTGNVSWKVNPHCVKYIDLSKKLMNYKKFVSGPVVEAYVVDLIWKPHRNGYLEHRVKIDPIILDGKYIIYVTAFNGSFIYHNYIGVGAKIEIVQSGNIIPYIRKTLIPAKRPKLPPLESIIYRMV